MKNKVLLVTLLLSVSTLAGCDKKEQEEPKKEATPIIEPTADETKEFGEAEKKLASQLLLNKKYLSIFVNEEVELVGKTRLYSTGKNLSYVVADPTIASVSEAGLVKGLASGETKITVTDLDNPHLSVEVPVYVNATINESRKTALVNEFKALGTEEVTAVVNHQSYEKITYKNDVVHKYLIEDEDMVASYDDAYFRITEVDSESITDNGSLNIAFFEWIFYTNPFYDTIVYHQTGDIKTYSPVATQSYMEKERTVPMFEILDNLFTSGSEVFTNVFRYASLGSVASMAETEDEGDFGSMGDGSMVFTSTATWESETATQDDETRYGIPYGTLTPTTQDMRFTIKDNKVVGVDIDIEMTYKIGSDNYREEYHIVYNYEEITSENRSQHIVVPNRKDYTLVDYLFAI